MKANKILTLFLLLFFGLESYSQSYRTGIGVRLASAASGITVKHFVNPDAAIEGILGFSSYRSTSITGLYEKHQSIVNAAGLAWFYGGGAHIGFYRHGYYDYYYRYHKGVYYYYEDEPSSVSLGLDLILGMEYKFAGAPITIGLDTKPFVDFPNGGPWFYWDLGFSARFTL